MPINGYHLGCPFWGMKEWVGHLYSAGAKAQDYLAEYARVWNAVEGNTTFYSLPTLETVRRWRDAVPSGFRFAFKLPQTITHRRSLEGSEVETAAFLERMAPLGERLGPFMVQLPPSFGPERLDALDRFLAGLPAELDFAVELRHRAFCDREAARRVDELLTHHGCERVVMDTRPLRSGDASHPDVAAARNKKPDLPVSPAALGQHPVLRLVCHPTDEVNEPWFALWRDVLAGWIAEGRRPHVFVHCPNDFHSPRLARRLHEVLASAAEVGSVPPWPGEERVAEEQLSLF